MAITDIEAGAQLPPARHTFTTVELFLFSAVSWHPHRIHFDQDYTREVEGHEDLLVHGPLQAVHLFDFLTRHVPGVELTAVDYRHRAPLHVGVPAVLGGEVTDVDADGATAEIDVWMAKEDGGERTTVGHASVRIAAQGEG